MADKAVSNISASILSDVNKGSLSGTCNYEPASSSEKWVYTERLISNASEPLLPTSQPYIDQYSNTGAQTTVAATDIYKYLCIKNTGTSDGSTTSEEGVVLSLDGDNAAHNEAQGIYIGPGEMWVSKFPSGTVQSQIYAITVAETNSVPSGTAGSTGVLCVIAAVLEDV
tara:strand:+ start:2553 stop:3059 length:507 start_codon:yes stop_codon:yes gene_type:complete